jgi:xyloglucan-specific endo-beta-1,4-glucanase
VNVGGYNWNLWQGPNQNWQVFSFVTADGDIASFSADLKDFFGMKYVRDDVYS